MTIAVGLNGALAAILPRDQSIYVYLLAVIVVAALSSVLIGVLTAIAGVIVYAWMSTPGHMPTAPVIVAFMLAAIVTVATRAAIQIRRPPIVTIEPPLLPPLERPAAVDIVVDDQRVEELNRELAAARAEIENERRLRSDVASAARKRESDLEDQIDALRGRAEDQGNRSVSARREFEAITKKLSDAETRTSALQKGLEVAQKKADEERARAEREAKMREQLEVAGHESLQKAVGDLTTKHDAAMLESKQRLEVAARKLELVQKELREERARAERESTLRTQTENAGTEKLQKTIVELNQKLEAAIADAQKRSESTTTKMNALQRELDRTLASLSQEHARADREAKLRSQLETAARETLHRTADVAAGRQKEANDAREAARAAEERLQTVQNEIEQMRASMQSEIESARHAADHERLRADLELNGRNKLAEELANARQELDAARSEVETQREHFAQLQAEREQEPREPEETQRLKDELQAATQKLQELQTAKSELDLANQKLQELQTAKSELALARTVIDNERKRASQMQAERDRIAKEFDEKLQHVVTGMTTDHENAIGDLLIEKSTAKAEMRTMNQKLHDLQHALEEERRRANEEKSAREKMDLEWSEKLQKIVTHLTEDHEADVGEALVAKEAARAEARTLSARVTLLQQKIEEEREKFRQAAERWQQERASLMSRRGAYPPTVEQPMPAAAEIARAATVLVVHSDAGVRAMSKHSLQQAGYTVLTAADGLEGLRTATQQKPDVVLAEAVMPKMNARELVQLLKSKRETADVKIILLSGAGSSDRGADFRADDVIHNPSDTNGLRAALANVLSRRVAS